MTNGILFNGKKFPEYIFSEKVASYLFFEFHFVFSDEFWTIFKSYLEENNIQTIIIENLKPEHPFKEEITVKDLPYSFMKSACSEKIDKYFSFGVSLHMITEEAIIYSDENKELFCIFLNRDYSLAILGFSHSRIADVLNNFSITDIPEFLREVYSDDDILLNSIEEQLISNWTHKN